VVLAIRDREGLIGREMFAIDGVKLPSNASKRKSGTRAEFARRADKLEQAARTMLARHREEDDKAVERARASEVQRLSGCTGRATDPRLVSKNPKERRR
jgi:hypothetical protein